MTGSVRVVSDGPIGGLLRFDLPGVGAGVVGASLPISDALFPVRRQEGGITTWAAIHNLESSPGLLRCDLMREGVLPDWHISTASAIPLATRVQQLASPYCVKAQTSRGKGGQRPERRLSTMKIHADVRPVVSKGGIRFALTIHSA